MTKAGGCLLAQQEAGADRVVRLPISHGVLGTQRLMKAKKAGGQIPHAALASSAIVVLHQRHSFMWQELTTLWQSIRDPEYLHLLIEPLPLYGLGLGLMFFIVAFVFGERRSRLLALGLICVSCASVWPYTDLREKATPRIIATRPPEYAAVIREQTQRRVDYAWPYYMVTVLSFIALFTGQSAKGKPVLLAVVAGGALLFWFSIWLHKKECEVYHRNIVRYKPPR